MVSLLRSCSFLWPATLFCSCCYWQPHSLPLWLFSPFFTSVTDTTPCVLAFHRFQTPSAWVLLLFFCKFSTVITSFYIIFHTSSCFGRMQKKKWYERWVKKNINCCPLFFILFSRVLVRDATFPTRFRLPLLVKWVDMEHTCNGTMCGYGATRGWT